MLTEEQRLKILKALRDSYANLTAEHTTEKEFENIIEAMEIVKNLTIPVVSDAERTLAIKFAQALLMDFEETTKPFDDTLCWQLCGTEIKLSTEEVFDRYIPEILANDC